MIDPTRLRALLSDHPPQAFHQKDQAAIRDVWDALPELLHAHEDRPRLLDECARWLDTAAKNWQAYQQLAGALRGDSAEPVAPLGEEEQAIVDEVANTLAKRTVSLVLRREIARLVAESDTNTNPATEE